MAYIRAQVNIPSDTTVPADAATNTFHFYSEVNDAATDAANAQTLLTTFYGAIDAELGAVIATPATVKYYDLLDPQPRVPVLSTTITLTAGAGNGLPTECAAVISYAAAAESGQSAARRRGRLYIGPMGASAASNVSGRVVVSGATITVLANAAATLQGGNPTVDTVWAVFSPTTAGPQPWSEGALESAFHQVANGYVDNAWDTQRRRGTAATVRTVW